jgi:hypothetical protein
VLADSGINPADIRDTDFGNAIFGFSPGAGVFEMPGRFGTAPAPGGGIQMVVTSVRPEEGVVRVVIAIADTARLVDQVQSEVLDSLIFGRVGSPPA